MKGSPLSCPASLIMWCLLCPSIMFSQLGYEYRCGHQVVQEQILKGDARTAIRQNLFEKKWVLHKKTSEKGHGKSTYKIPVVVHVIHDNGPENISDLQIQNAIEYLNLSFANADPYDPSDGVGVDIEFCLASMDVNGQPSNGIERVRSPLTTFVMETQDIKLKSLSRWPSTCYCNIYVVSEIISASSGPGVVGYAFFPSTHGQPEDGIVMEAEYFGTDSGTNTVLSHEMGHYLGLYHTFQGGCKNDDCLMDGDQVCDTPPDRSTARIRCKDSVKHLLNGRTVGVSDRSARLE